MAVHYQEFMKSASAEQSCQVGSIDLGGALTYQGPITPEQQGKLVLLFTEISTANGELLKTVRERMKALAAESASKKGTPPTDKKPTNPKK